MTRVPRGGGSQEGTTGDLLSHQPEFLGTPLNYYELRESDQKSTRVRGEGHCVQGCTQQPGVVDFDQTHCATMRGTSLRLLSAVAGLWVWDKIK